MLQPLDGQIVHALQLSPRASFRRIADVIGVPEQTVARRYRKLRRDGVLRVVGLVNARVYGEHQWIVRVHAKPDDLPRLAEALVRRPEVTHANVLSGWTELVCLIRAPLGDNGTGGLLHRLPRTSSVLGMDVDLVLHVYGGPSGVVWTGYGHTLGADQSARLTADVGAAASMRPPAALAREDQPLVDALAEDGRTPHARLAELTGWSPARVKRRLAALEASGTVTYDLDVLPERLGFLVNAQVWITTPPSDLHRVAEQIAAHDEIASVVAVSGRSNLVAVVICRDAEHLYRYLSERLSAVGQVLGYDVSIRTKRLKQAASLIAQGRLVRA